MASGKGNGWYLVLCGRIFCWIMCKKEEDEEGEKNREEEIRSCWGWWWWGVRECGEGGEEESSPCLCLKSGIDDW